ncbi:MAG: peptide ABC transporter substrate-binding protein [Bdellovibrionales bacterium]|nr:peptide ABC transporter substrate-binding protein [Bdellovibrionales bacterium]
MKKILPLLLLSLTIACTKKDTHPDYYGTVIPKHPADEMWTDAGGEPQYMDPAQVSDSVSQALTDAMFVRLTEVHPITQKPIGDFATSWDLSQDGREYTFHLREDAKWSDGKPMTAHDVEYSWKRLLNPKTVSTYSQMADIIQNGRAFREGSVTVTGLKNFDAAESKMIQDKLPAQLKDVEITSDARTKNYFLFVKDEDAQAKKDKKDQLIEEINKGILGSDIKAEPTTANVVQVQAKDDYTLWVQLVSPAPYFVGMISYMVFAPVPKHVIEKFEAQGRPELWTRAENIVVSGAFKLVEEEFKQYKIYQKNPLYFHADKVRLNKVKAIMIENAQPTMNAYKVGQHDWSSSESYPSEYVDEMRKYKDTWFYPKTAVYYYQFNVERKPLNDKRVRQALSLAVDRKSIVDNILKLGQIPSRDLVMEGLGGYKSIQSEVYNPAKAKQLLSEAGYPNGKDFPKILVKFNTLEGHRKIAEAVQEMWKNNLNIHVEITNMEWRTLIEDQNVHNFDIMRMAWVADYLDPHTFLSVFLSHSTNNHTGWKNAKFDELMDQSDYMRDPEARLSLFQEAEHILADEQPIMPIYWYSGTKQVKPYVKGIFPSLQDKYNWKYMWIDERWYKGVPENPDAVPNVPWE